MNPFARKKDEPAKQPDPVTPPAGAGAGAGGAADATPDRDPDQTAAQFEGLEAEIRRLADENAQLTLARDEAQDAHRRALADFSNFQRRATASEQQARESGARGVLYGVITVVDHFEMALGLDPDKSTARQVISGVSMIKEEILSVLSQHGVEVIRPGKGEAFDPNKHEAMSHVVDTDVPPGNVISTARPGFVLSGRTLRPAQVIVAKAPANAAE